jgi:hypothetical protein
MPVYTNPTIDQDISPKVVFYVDNKCAIFTCNGSPEGVILANTGSIAISDNASIYKKTTDDLTTGWVELASGTVSSPLVISGTNPTLSFVDTTAGDDDGSISMDADNMSITVVGGTPVTLKPNGQFIGYSRNIVNNFIQAANVGAGLDPLQSVVVPANSLNADNDFLDIIQSGSYANTAVSKRLAFTIDGQSIHDTGLIAIGNAGAGAEWIAITRIIRVSATSVRSIFFLSIGNTQHIQAATAIVATAGGVKVSRESVQTVANLNSNPVTILVSGEATNNNDIIQDITMVGLTQLS